MTIHGNNPAVQDLRRTRLLPAEIVDEIDAVVGLELEGCIVDFRRGVVSQIEQAQAQLPTGDDAWPFATDPTAVVPRVGAYRTQQLRGILELLMINRIEQFDDLALALDGVRHIDRRAVNAKQRLGEVRFSVPGLAVDEERFSRVH